MDEFMETLVEHNMAEESANLNIQKLGRDDVLGTGGAEIRWPGWPGDNVFRMLVPSQKVGSIIGLKGVIIKKICKEAKAGIKIVDGPPGTPESAVIISAKEQPDVPISPAMDCLFRVHKHIVNGLDGEVAHAPPNGGYHLPTRLLVTVAQAAFLIGKHGVTIKSFEEASKAVIQVVGELPPVALLDDQVVEILGEPAAMHKALELIANHLRKFLVDRSVLPLFEMNMLMQLPQMGRLMHNPHLEQHMCPHMVRRMHPAYMEQHMPPPQLWGPHTSPLNAGGPGYGPVPQFIPVRPHDYFCPPPDYPVAKPPHRRIFPDGREAPPMGAHPSMNQPPQMSSQATHHMQVPISYADVVIGSAGANISYIRRTSGATINIKGSDTSREMVIEIIGSAVQVHTAQQLVLMGQHMQGHMYPHMEQHMHTWSKICHHLNCGTLMRLFRMLEVLVMDPIPSSCVRGHMIIFILHLIILLKIHLTVVYSSAVRTRSPVRGGPSINESTTANVVPTISAKPVVRL